MYSGVKAYGGPHEASGIAASLYFVLLVILGNCILESKRDFNFEKLIFFFMNFVISSDFVRITS